MDLGLSENSDLKSYDYHLPEKLIARFPSQKRDHSKLLKLDKKSGALEHLHFFDVVEHLPTNSVLVINNTKVIPARVLGKRKSGGAVEALLIKSQDGFLFKAMVKPLKKLKINEELLFADGNSITKLIEKNSDGTCLLQFDKSSNVESFLLSNGKMPLPPYILKARKSDQTDGVAKININDKERYQTTYAKNLGSIAAPTAGLHFTKTILDKLKAKGIEICEVTLHVGLGTFKTVESNDLSKHEMHSEYYEMSQTNYDLLLKAKAKQKKIIAVGTTSVRTLETIFQNYDAENLKKPNLSGFTKIFIYPPYKFKIVDALITNFHLPKSTLLMLISALAGKDNVKKAYSEAINENYRFFSYGDAMLIQ